MSGELYRRLFENMREGYAYCQVFFEDGKACDFLFLTVNRAFETLTGLKDVAGKRVSGVVPGIRESDPSLFEICGRVALTGTPEKFEIFVAALQQRFSVSAYRPEPGHFVAVFDVITGRKRMEVEIRRRAEELEAVLQSVPAVVWIAHDPDCVHITGNRMANRILRLQDDAEASLTAPEGKRPTHFRVFKDRRRLAGHELPVQRAARGEAVSDFECRVAYDDGTDCHLLGNAIPLYHEDGRPRGAVAAFIDISDRKKLEEKLQVSEVRYRRLFETAKDGILILDADTGRITDANRYVQEMLEYSGDELIGKTLWEIGTFRDIAASMSAFRKLQRKKYIRYDDLPLETKGRKKRHVEFVSNVYRENGAKVIQCNIRDITERHQAKMVLANASRELEIRVAERTVELVDANRLMKGMLDEGKRAEGEIKRSRERLRKLTGRLQSLLEEERTRISREVHDVLGQALTALKLDLSSLRREFVADGLAGQSAKIQQAERTVNRIIRTVRKISTELRPGILDELGVAAAIQWLAKDFQDRTGIGCTVSLKAVDRVSDPELSTAVFRIVQESLTNVIRHSGASKVKVSLEKRNGKLTLEVKDNGVGIAEERVSGFTSLGLTGIRERALQLGGEAVISGNPGKGTSVRVTLPAGKGAKPDA